MLPRECVVMSRSRFGIGNIRPVLVQFWCMFTGLFRFHVMWSCSDAVCCLFVQLHMFLLRLSTEYWMSHQLASIACHATHRQSASSLTYGVLIKTTQPWIRSMGMVTPLLMHWNYHGFYHSLALSRRENGLAPNHWWPLWPLMTQFTDAWNYSDATMSTMASQITSLTIVYPTVYSGADQRKKIKAPRHWPLCGECTGDQWIPRTKGQ